MNDWPLEWETVIENEQKQNMKITDKLPFVVVDANKKQRQWMSIWMRVPAFVHSSFSVLTIARSVDGCMSNENGYKKVLYKKNYNFFLLSPPPPFFQNPLPLFPSSVVPQSSKNSKKQDVFEESRGIDYPANPPGPHFPHFDGGSRRQSRGFGGAKRLSERGLVPSPSRTLSSAPQPHTLRGWWLECIPQGEFFLLWILIKWLYIYIILPNGICCKNNESIFASIWHFIYNFFPYIFIPSFSYSCFHVEKKIQIKKPKPKIKNSLHFLHDGAEAVQRCPALNLCRLTILRSLSGRTGREWNSLTTFTEYQQWK